MSNICKPNCVTVLPNFGSIDQCDITALLSSGEITNVIFAKCNETFDDIDSPNEWQSKITDVVYKGKELRKRINEEINKKGEIKPTSHAMLSASLFVDAFANGSAAVSQTNIPEDGLSNIDRNINRSTLLKLLYAPFRVLNATDIATMTLAKDPLKRKKK